MVKYNWFGWVVNIITSEISTKIGTLIKDPYLYKAIVIKSCTDVGTLLLIISLEYEQNLVYHLYSLSLKFYWMAGKAILALFLLIIFLN